VKICGLTREDEAVACAEAGASVIGCVFYPPSPRYVSEEIARSISRAVSAKVPCVGVFVNEGYSDIMRKVERCGLKAVQLHGKEPPLLVKELNGTGITVIKAVFENAEPSFASVDGYSAGAYLVECAGGPLPGGNAMSWNWGAAAELAARRPVILAGGLNPENVGRAICAALPDAVDVSSGVESRPGRKDIDKVKRFLEAVLESRGSGKYRRIFR
jgi:phosphoribosylanthranilate isomerase